MLRKTFCHLPGFGLKTEARLWRRGILTWEDFIGALPAFSGPGMGRAASALTESITHIEDPAYFARLLPPGELWRLYSEFMERTAFVDIETNGLAGPEGHITTIALYDGRKVKTYVRGLNLDDFIADLGEYDVIVTYNGRCFDVPFIEREFSTRLERAHIDLIYIMRALGMKGGLKACEKALGIERGMLDGMDGYLAVLLWRDFISTGSGKALSTLLAYNCLDAVNLEALLIEAFNRRLSATPFYPALSLAPKRPDVELPQVCRRTIERVMRKNPRYARRTGYVRRRSF